ncbi:hypothetical protein [Virgibacillus ainsalahensis]
MDSTFISHTYAPHFLYAEETVTLTPPLYNTNEAQMPTKDNDKSVKKDLSLNPLFEKEHVIKTTVSKIATNQGEQITFIFKSREKYTEQQILLLLSQIINQINTLDVSVNNQHIESTQQAGLAKEFIKHGKESLNSFP